MCLVTMLLQAREVFFKQRWLGVTAMQSPFDFMAIADIIHEVQPDVILETGELQQNAGRTITSMLPRRCLQLLQGGLDSACCKAAN